MSKWMRIAMGGVGLSLVAAAIAQAPIYYPAKGQSHDQMQKDEGECYTWAKGNTGIDPAALAATPVPQQQSSFGGGERAGGALRGAAGGAAIGAIAGDAGKGAAIGAVAGTMVGGRRARDNQAANNQAAQNQRAQTVNTFYRAQAACMSGRGYTVQ